MTHTPIIICEAGAYSDLDNTGIVILHGDRRVAVFHHIEEAQHWTACVNALQGFPIEAIEAGAVAELVSWAKAMLPRNLSLTNRNIRDDLAIPLETTMGELRRLSAALSQLAEASNG